VALALACKSLQQKKIINRWPLISPIAAISVGIVSGRHVLDLNYEEDSRAAVDFNVVMLGTGELVEVQGTAEGNPFNREDVNALLDLAEKGLKELFTIQEDILNKA
jgi:ribonuclease PH